MEDWTERKPSWAVIIAWYVVTLSICEIVNVPEKYQAIIGGVIGGIGGCLISQRMFL